MPTIRSNGVWLHFEQDGDPSWPTVLLVHGFASSADDNWLATGWVKRLREAKRRTVRIDCRGHGRSEKPHDPAAYSLDLLAADLEELLRYANARTRRPVRLLDGRAHLPALPRAQAGAAALGDPGRHRRERARRACPRTTRSWPRSRRPTRAKIASPVGRVFREFAQSRGNDLRALAALRRGPRTPAPNREALAKLSLPALWSRRAAKDTLVGDARRRSRR